MAGGSLGNQTIGHLGEIKFQALAQQLSVELHQLLCDFGGFLEFLEVRSLALNTLKKNYFQGDLFFFPHFLSLGFVFLINMLPDLLLFLQL